MPTRTRIALVAALGGAVVALGACDSDAGSRSASTTTTPSAAPLRILVTNDDGFAATGIDTVVTALRKLPAVRVTVVAPATNQSGTGGKTTAGTLRALGGTRRTASG